MLLGLQFPLLCWRDRCCASPIIATELLQHTTWLLTTEALILMRCLVRRAALKIRSPQKQQVSLQNSGGRLPTKSKLGQRL
jgi:hypothetical protein